MKTINKNTEKKQRVRVLETGQLGTVTDQQLSPRDGQLHRYMQVKLDGQPHLDRWFWDYQLGDMKERCRVTLEDDTNTYRMDITRNHENGDYDIHIHSKRDDNTKHVGDLSFRLVRLMLEAMGATPEDLMRVITGEMTVLAPPRCNR